MSYCPSTIPDILHCIQDQKVNSDDFFLLLIGEKQAPDLQQLRQSLIAEKVEFMGGIFPGLVWGKEKLEEGVLVIPLGRGIRLYEVEGLSGEEFVLPEVKANLFSDEKETAFILIDGLTAYISEFLQEIHNQLGHQVDFLGGGAGSLTLQQQPCLLSSSGVYQDAALMALIPRQVKLGVNHGWRKIKGPLVATRTDRNIIQELNWQNAFQVYQEVVNEDSPNPIHQDNFFEVAKGYPFGLSREGEEDIVRDPISAGENGELVCVGEVPENSVLNILKGENEALIDSAAKASLQALEELNGHKAAPILVDCISRVLFLEENFEEELSAIQEQLLPHALAPLHGILSLGEISSYGAGNLAFFNKTVVLGLLEQ